MAQDASTPSKRSIGVERWVILAIWGMETSYGALKDNGT